MKVTKKYLAMDPMKSCAFSFSGIQCKDCRFRIPRYTPEQLETERENGNYEVNDDSYSCIFMAAFIELQKATKLLTIK